MSGGFSPRTKRRFIGAYQPKIEGREKASGQAEYLDDIAMGIKFPGLLHARILRSPHAHARIRGLDIGAARALPGVRDILTYTDNEIASLRGTTCAWTSVNTASCDKMYFPGYKDHRVLSDHVCWYGDEAGVVVAAESEEIAEEALRLIRVDWEVLPFVIDPEEALREGAPVIHPEINPRGNLIPPDEFGGPDVFWDKGDADRALAEAQVRVEVTTKWHNADHSCLDTRGCLMEWKRGRLTCWTNYYQADQTRMHISQMLEIPINKVRVMNPYVGASMGRSNTGEQLFFIFTAILAQRTGRPVKFKHTRREDFHDTRNAVKIVCRLGADREGRIQGAHLTAHGDAGAYVEHTMAAVKFVAKGEIVECMLAHLPNLKLEGYGVYTNKIPGSCMRGIGNAQYNLALNRALDELAERLDLDPIELALLNYGHEWEGLPNKSLEAILREGAQRIGWERRHPPDQGPFFDGTKKRGLGFSCHMAWHAAWQELPRGHVQVGIKLNPDLSVILEAPMVETGTGSNSCAVFACAEALAFLGVTPEDIHWNSRVDTDTGYKDMVQTDSAVSYLQAEMMPQAAARIKAKICELAAPQFECGPLDLDIDEGLIFLKADPNIKLPVADFLWEGDLVPILVTVNKTLPPQKTGIPYVATFVEVEVDTETGRVEVLKMAVVHDCGTVMFASGAEGQMVGGQCMGLGEALYEEIVYDRLTGIPLNFNWIDYTFPTMLDFPAIDPVLMEVWQGAGEYGACGTGEVAPICAPRAVSNAVYNAVGVRVDDIPIKPEKVLAALEAKAGPEKGASR